MSSVISCHSSSIPHTKPLWSSHTKHDIAKYAFQASSQIIVHIAALLRMPSILFYLLNFCLVLETYSKHHLICDAFSNSTSSRQGKAHLLCSFVASYALILISLPLIQYLPNCILVVHIQSSGLPWDQGLCFFHLSICST